MAALAAIGLGLSAVGALSQVISGESRRVKAKRALENFQRQELKNITEGLRVSTLGAELQTQEAQRRFATSVDALRSGGVRGVVGGLGQQEQLQQRQQQQISADLDKQQMFIEQMRAQDEARIRQMIESRESAQIAGLGSEMAAGSRSVQAGLGGLASTGLAAYQIQSLTGNGVGDGSGGSGAANSLAAANLLSDATRQAAASTFGNVKANELQPGREGLQSYFSVAGETISPLNILDPYEAEGGGMGMYSMVGGNQRG